MKNKWHANQVKIAQKWLAETWPGLFTPGRDLKPLSLKVHKEILQHPGRPAGAPRRAVTEALKRHTKSFGYLFGLTKHSHRYGLDLAPAEVISEIHKDWAQRTLRRQQKLSQASKRKAARVQPIQREHSSRQTTVPQITYKKTRRRLLLKPVQAGGASTVSEIAAA